MIAAYTTSRYANPVYSARMNAAEPMIGGIALPPVEAATSTAPAKRAE